MQRFLSYENTILAVVMMVSFINPFTSSALTTALPGIGTAYGATDAKLSWVIELFLISSTVTIMPISKIADRIGKRHVFLFGVSLFCVSSLAVYFVTSLYGLFLLRILQGLGSASIFATSMAIVSLVTPPERRGRAMGFTIAAVYCGLSFGPVLGGFFSYYLGWKTIFYFIAIICAVAWLIALYSMKKEEWIVNAHGSLDLFGSLLYALAMIAIMVGLSEVTSLFYAKYLLAAGFILFLVFLYGEWHRKSPVLPVRIFAAQTPVKLIQLCVFRDQAFPGGELRCQAVHHLPVLLQHVPQMKERCLRRLKLLLRRLLFPGKGIQVRTFSAARRFHGGIPCTLRGGFFPAELFCRFPERFRIFPPVILCHPWHPSAWADSADTVRSWRCSGPSVPLLFRLRSLPSQAAPAAALFSFLLPQGSALPPPPRKIPSGPPAPGALCGSSRVLSPRHAPPRPPVPPSLPVPSGKHPPLPAFPLAGPAPSVPRGSVFFLSPLSAPVLPDAVLPLPDCRRNSPEGSRQFPYVGTAGSSDVPGFPPRPSMPHSRHSPARMPLSVSC